jgi:hypothetical protein
MSLIIKLTVPDSITSIAVVFHTASGTSFTKTSTQRDGVCSFPYLIRNSIIIAGLNFVVFSLSQLPDEAEQVVNAGQVEFSFSYFIEHTFILFEILMLTFEHIQ